MNQLRYFALALLIVGGLVGCAKLSKTETDRTALFQRKPDPRVLQNIPKMRHDALALCVEGVGGDSTPERFKKQEGYIDSLKLMLKKLQDEYYYWDENPNELIEIADEHAMHLAMLQVPMYNGVRAGSGYEGAINRQSIQLYENMIVTAAYGICGYMKHYDVTISYNVWKSSWDDAAKMAKRPNTALEPTPTTP
jgi:hypothetical protein